MVSELQRFDPLLGSSSGSEMKMNEMSPAIKSRAHHCGRNKDERMPKLHQAIKYSLPLRARASLRRMSLSVVVKSLSVVVKCR